jgi:hypothetical protein
MLLLALAVLLTDAIVEVPRSGWRAIELPVPHNGSVVEGRFQAVRGARVQLLILPLSEAQRLNRGRSFRPLYSSGFRDSGRFQVSVSDAGAYVLVIDNRIEGRFPAQVRLDVDVSHQNEVEVRELPPERRRAVVAVSLLGFGAIVAGTAWLFLRQAA